MSKKKIKEKEMSLSYVISLYKKKGMNLKAATQEAKIYMLGSFFGSFHNKKIYVYIVFINFVLHL